VVFHKTISFHTKCHVTLDTFERRCWRHAPCWTRATLPFHGIAARPLIIVTCVQSFNVSRSWSWPPYSDGCSWLVPSPCQHISDKSESKISVRFSSHHMKIKGCNYWEVEKELFCPLPCSAAGLVFCHPIFIINMPHVMVIVRHNCQLYRVPVFIMVNAFSGWIVNVFSGGTSVLSLHTTAVMSPLALTWMLPCSSLSVLGLRSLGIPFLCSHTFVQQVRGGKEVVHVEFIAKCSPHPPVRLILYCGLLSGVVLPFVWL